MKSTLLAGVGLLALSMATSGAARAADAAAPTLPAWSWSGFYLGAHGGYAWARDPFDEPIFSSPPSDLTGVNSRGWLAGFQAGANWQKGAWVGGLEIDISGTGIGGTDSLTHSFATPGLTTTDTLSLTDKFDMIGSGRVRLGYLPWPNVLLYGTGGLAWARIDQTFVATTTQTSRGITDIITESSTIPAWRFGWAAGFGAETRLWNSNWLARLEYLHYDFGDTGNASSVLTLNGTTTSSAFTSNPITVDLVRAGLTYKFGAGPLAAASPAGGPPIFTKAPQRIAVPWSWSGFYIGGHGGYGWAHDPFSEQDLVGNTPITMPGIESSGLLGGFQAGANWQKDAWVGGLEIDLSATSISGSRTASGSTTSGGLFSTGTLTEADRFPLLGSARARFGYLVQPTTLFYGTAGLAWTRQDASFTDSETTIGGGINSASTFSESTPNWLFGWVAGLGVEKRIADTNLIGRVEYLHYDFGDTGSSMESDTTGGVTTISNVFTSGHITFDVLRAGVSYKFGGSDAGAPAPVLVTKAPPSATAGWSGFYIGAHGGYGWGRDPFATVNVPSVPGFVTLNGIDSNGWVGGFQAGANWQFDRWLAGAELDFSASGIKNTASGSATDGINTNMLVQTDQFDWLGSGRARLGFLPTPNFLVYGTGGLAWTRFTQSFVSTEISPGDVFVATAATPVWRWGWAAGIGAEMRIARSNWLGRIEYLHYDFGDSGGNSTSSVSNGISVSTNDMTTGRLSADVVRAGVSYLLQ